MNRDRMLWLGDKRGFRASIEESSAIRHFAHCSSEGVSLTVRVDENVEEVVAALRAPSNDIFSSSPPSQENEREVFDIKGSNSQLTKSSTTSSITPRSISLPLSLRSSSGHLSGQKNDKSRVVTVESTVRSWFPVREQEKVRGVPFGVVSMRSRPSGTRSLLACCIFPVLFFAAGRRRSYLGVRSDTS
mmetsp:Transcript_13972/g.28626  ORF Transcript_13972/g.28626 Transcript_13972/m.28626 type:complete len:188 (-) Transcript_13972:394-957(-)